MRPVPLIADASLAIITMMSMIMFIWHAELHMTTLIANVQLTNGFRVIDSMKAYHIFMYIMVTLVGLCLIRMIHHAHERTLAKKEWIDNL